MHHTTDTPPIIDTRASGKLLLSGEYFVMDGAQALAVPTRFGQSLRVEAWKEPNRLSWTSKNEHGDAWFLAEFELPGLDILNATDRRTADILISILRSCQRQNPAFLDGSQGCKVRTQNDFPRTWGLGTSSTLIAAIARWADTDPYRMLADTLGGSGYDLACAYAEGPILYWLDNGKPMVAPADFHPDFSDQLLFVYLEKKQDSRAGIKWYREKMGERRELIGQATELTRRFTAAGSLEQLMSLIDEHENFIAEVLELPRVQTQLFADFPGQIKSLGAWGGDFILSASPAPLDEQRAYFREKGFSTSLAWGEMLGTLSEK
jgi:mevalonate kinase